MQDNRVKGGWSETLQDSVSPAGQETHGGNRHDAVAQSASGAGLHKVACVAWLHVLLPDEPPITLSVIQTAPAGKLLRFALGLFTLLQYAKFICAKADCFLSLRAVLQLERTHVQLWLDGCVHGQVEAIESASGASAAWTGVALWDTSAHASLCSAPAGPQQPAALRLGLCYGVQSAATHSMAGQESRPGEVAVLDSVLIRVCDPRCVPAVGTHSRAC